MSAGDAKSILCPNCGERNPPTRTLCWLCYASLDRKALHRPPPAEPIFDEAANDSPTTLVVLLVALAVVCFGVLLVAPGLGIALAILLTIPFVRTSILVKRRAEAGVPTSTSMKVFLFVGSIVISGVVIAVVTVVAVGTFCATCLGMAALTSSSRGVEEEVYFIVAGGAAFAATCGVGYLIYRVIRHRWNRDLER